jgi:hypothetical protein
LGARRAASDSVGAALRLGRLLKKIHMLRSTQSPHYNSCSWFVFVQISRSRFTDTITRNVRLASEVFLSNLQEAFLPSTLLGKKRMLVC